MEVDIETLVAQLKDKSSCLCSGLGVIEQGKSIFEYLLQLLKHWESIIILQVFDAKLILKVFDIIYFHVEEIKTEEKECV